MLANPEMDVDTTGTFSALSTEVTESPTETTENPESTENLETTSQTPPQGIEKPEQESDSKDNHELTPFTIKRDGKEIELFVKGELEEPLPNELMMTHTFYKKTEELANERKSLEATKQEFDSTLEDMRNHLDYKIDKMNSKEMLELKESDPTEYWERYGKLQEEVETFKKYSEKRQQELKESQASIMKKEIERWPEVIPEWQNSDVMKEDTGKIYTMLSSEGFDDQTISNIYDSRIIRQLWKAMKYDEASKKAIQSKQKTPSKHVPSNSTATSKPKEEKSLEQIFYGG